MQVGTLLVSASDDPGPGLACSFKITRSLATARAGTCELVIHNLSRSRSAELGELPRRTSIVAIDAGYAEGQSRLFTGDLRKVIPSRGGATWTVSITAGDGEHARRTARVSRSFAAGTSTAVAAQAVAEAMGVGVGNAAAAFRGTRLNGHGPELEDGLVIQGNAAAAFTDLCNAAGLIWSIQDGVIQVLPLGGASATTAIRIGADSGMIDSPTVVDRRTVTVKCLLQPGLAPGQRVVIDSALVAGVWRISELTFTGETHGNAWEAELTCKRPRTPLLDRSAPGVTAVDS